MKPEEIKEAWNGQWLTSVPGDKRNIYKRNQDRLRYLAIEWQYEFANEIYSWSELMDIQSWFYEKAKQYGLMKEFKEEGII